MFKTISENLEGQIVEKKSKFIANVIKVNSEEEAASELEKIRKKHFDAKHHVFSYVIQKDENSVIERFSDDGEPSGTAGQPILNILRNEHITNVIVVVTRYFGGILLGTGGLIKAYQDATKMALEGANYIEQNFGIKYSIKVSYDNLKDTLYNCKKYNCKVIETKYDDKVEIILVSTDSNKKSLEESINIEQVKIIDNNVIFS